MIVKAAGVVLGVGLISTGGIAMTKPHWLGMDYMPSWKPLSKDTNYSTVKDSDYGTDKFGNKRGNYLTGVIGNESWWEWSFRRLKAANPPATGKFKYNNGNGANVDSAYDHKSTGTPNAKALNQVCKEAYKTKESEMQEHNGTDINKFKKSDVWKYCSPIGQKPTTVKEHDRNGTNNKYEDGGTTEKIGKNKESDLISVFDKGNDIFWDMRNKEIKDKVLSVDSTHTFFKKAEEANTHIKDLCKEAYDKPSTNTGGTSPSPSSDETKKYCSLAGS